MARLIQASRRTLLSHSFLNPKTLLPKLTPLHTPHLTTPISQTRNYISEMRKATIEGHILRVLRNEIQYENENAPPKQPAEKYDRFIVEGCPGEQWIRLRSKDEKEEIKIECTMFDGEIPCRNEKGEEEMELHLSFIVDILKRDTGDIIQFICSAVRHAVLVQQVFFSHRNGSPGNPYMGPFFQELDEEFQESLLEFLDERGVNDELAGFLHDYMHNKDKTELLRWMEKVKAFIEE